MGKCIGFPALYGWGRVGVQDGPPPFAEPSDEPPNILYNMPDPKILYADRGDSDTVRFLFSSEPFIKNTISSYNIYGINRDRLGSGIVRPGEEFEVEIARVNRNFDIEVVLEVLDRREPDYPGEGPHYIESGKTCSITIPIQSRAEYENNNNNG